MAPAKISEVLFLPGCQFARPLPPDVAGLLEAGLAALILPADLVDGAIEQLDHVIAVDGEARVLEVFLDAVAAGLPEISAEVDDRRRLPVVGLEVGLELADQLLLPARGGEDPLERSRSMKTLT